MCYVLPEGVVFGADSTTSTTGDSFHYYNHNQKLFEVGDKATLGILTWGLSSLSETSFRTIIANVADGFIDNPPLSVEEAADRWAATFHTVYSADPLLQLYGQLKSKAQHQPGGAVGTAVRTKQEEDVFVALTTNLIVGFCLAGRAGTDRTPGAYEMLFEPAKPPPKPVPIPCGTYRFWGVPNMADRLITGADNTTRNAIVSSPLWTGTRADLDCLLTSHHLGHSRLPIRDAVDFVHMCIHSTIKALKFSPYFQVCGGPIEIAIVTTDRPYRWVRHKKWDAALTEGEA